MRRSAYFAHRAEVTGWALSKTAAIMTAAQYYAVVQATTGFRSRFWSIVALRQWCQKVDFQSKY